MNLMNLFGGDVVKEVGDTLDNLFTSDEERESLKNELARSDMDYRLELKRIDADMQKSEDENTTKRWTSDNESMITRLVRPVGLIYMLVVFTIVMFMDGNVGDFLIDEAYIPLVKDILITMIFAYYGSRGIEKTIKTIQDKKESR